MRSLACLLAWTLFAGPSAAQQLKEAGSWPAPGGGVASLAISPDGKTLAVGSRGYDRKATRAWGELKLFDVPSGKEQTTLQGHNDGIAAVTFAPDGKALATAGGDAVILWDAAAGRELHAWKGVSYVRSLAFSPDGKWLAVADRKEARIMEVATGQPLSSLTYKDRDVPREFSPDLKTLAAPDHQDVVLWDVESGKERLFLEEHRGGAWWVRFTADGKQLWVVSNRMLDDNSYRSELRCWDAAAGKEVRTLRPDLGYLSGLAVSPDGKLLAVTGARYIQDRQDVKLLDAISGKELAALRSKADWRRLQFSPDGRFLVVGSHQEVKFWEIVPAKDR